MSLKILQLSSDWKWTGPAEPMLRLAEAQRARGHTVVMAYPSPAAGANRSLATEAEAAGFVSVAPLDRRRGVHLLGDRADAARLRELLRAQAIDVVHCWHTRDHVLAWRAARGRRDQTAIVRSYRSAERIARTPWNRWLFGPAADGLLCVSPETARSNSALRGGRPIAGAFGAVDLARFQPAKPDPAVRASLGFAPEHEVIGIVARVQPHRRFDLLLAAARQLFARRPNARLLVVGRGTHRVQLAERPAEQLGIADRVVFAGYRAGDYADVLRAIDVFTFLVPGSDGTCRALLEAAACGIPAVTTRRGALAEIVVDGETGALADETPASLAAAWEGLLADPARRAALGAAASQRARLLFTPEKLADAVLRLYDAASSARSKRA
ncbi:MAG: glycosyl transferase group 1 [Deltaproteobacteria bacterium]|nr:glycosyl transferase group 1 [Deltaproteobacteria bacterium]